MRVILLMLFDIICEIFLETDNNPRPFFALLRLLCLWRRSVWKTTRCVRDLFVALLRLLCLWRRSVWRATRRVRDLYRSPTQLQNFIITKSAVEEFMEQLLVTRTIDHASPS